MSIENDLAALRAQIEPETCFCLVELPDGTRAEKPIEEWVMHRGEWSWQGIVRGGDNAAVMLMLAVVNDEAAEAAMEKGDQAAALRLTAASAHFLAQYERRARG